MSSAKIDKYEYLTGEEIVPFNQIQITMYNLTECGDDYLETSGILWQFCTDVLALNAAGDEIADFTESNATTESFNLKEKLTGQTSNNGTKNVKIMVPLKRVSNFWRTLEMSLINSEIILDLKWSEK